MFKGKKKVKRYELPQKIRTLVPYEPISGEFSVRLDANESFIPAELNPELLRLAAANRYPDPYCERLLKKYGEVYDVNHNLLTAGNGSDELISIIISCFLDNGKKVAALSLDFSMYYFYPKIFGKELAVFPKSGDLTVDVEKLVRWVNTNGIDCLIFSNPCNPTSLGLDKKSVVHIIENVNALVIIDEAYMEFWGGLVSPNSVLRDVSKYENLFVLKTFSKALGAAALRLGIAAANEKLTNALRSAKSPYNLNGLTQLFGESILADKSRLESNVERIVKSREELFTALSHFSFVENMYGSCTNFVFIKSCQSEKVYSYLQQKGIAVRFIKSESDSFLRITAGKREENGRVIEALTKGGY